jgi:hypothetical protein
MPHNSNQRLGRRGIPGMAFSANLPQLGPVRLPLILEESLNAELNRRQSLAICD